MNSKEPLPPSPSALENSEGFIAANLTAVRTSLERSVKDAAAYAQLQPAKALLYAVGAGYLLRMLPLSGIVGALIRALLALVKPAALLYGAAKVWQKAQPLVAPRHPTDNE